MVDAGFSEEVSGVTGHETLLTSLASHFPWLRADGDSGDSLRREIPAKGVEDIEVDGKSWNLID
jgi:hypothetical protein